MTLYKVLDDPLNASREDLMTRLRISEADVDGYLRHLKEFTAKRAAEEIVELASERLGHLRLADGVLIKELKRIVSLATVVVDAFPEAPRDDDAKGGA